MMRWWPKRKVEKQNRANAQKDVASCARALKRQYEKVKILEAENMELRGKLRECRIEVLFS